MLYVRNFMLRCLFNINTSMINLYHLEPSTSLTSTRTTFTASVSGTSAGKISIAT